MSTAGGDVECLVVVIGTGLGLSLDGRVTVRQVSQRTVCFSERPCRFTSHIPTGQSVSNRNVGANDLAENPPNALLSVVEDGAAGPRWSSSRSRSRQTAT